MHSHVVDFGSNIGVIIAYLVQENNTGKPISHLQFTNASDFTTFRGHPVIDLSLFTNLTHVHVKGRVPVSCIANFRFCHNSILTLEIDNLVHDSDTLPFPATATAVPPPLSALSINALPTGALPTAVVAEHPPLGLQGISVVCGRMETFSACLRLLSTQEPILFSIRNLTFTKITNTTNINATANKLDSEAFASLTNITRIGHSKHSIDHLTITIVIEGVSRDIEFVESDLQCQVHHARLFAWMVNAKHAVLCTYDIDTLKCSSVSSYTPTMHINHHTCSAPVKFIQCQFSLDPTISSLESVTTPSHTMIMCPQNIQDTLDHCIENDIIYSLSLTQEIQTLYLKRCSTDFWPLSRLMTKTCTSLIVDDCKMFASTDIDYKEKPYITSLVMLECSVHFQELHCHLPNATHIVLSNCNLSLVDCDCHVLQRKNKIFHHITLHATSSEKIIQLLNILDHLTYLQIRVKHLHINIPESSHSCLAQSPNVKRRLRLAADRIVDGTLRFY